jgi:tyrosine-protein kinase Etk/Wzc
MNTSIPMPSGSPMRPQKIAAQEIDFREYLSVIMRRRKVLILTLLTVFILVALYSFLAKPVYEASATLHVKDDKLKKGGMLGELALTTSNPIGAELEILKSRTNAEWVVRHLHLNWQVSKKTDELEFKILDFSSGAGEELPVYQIELTGTDTFTVRDKEGNLVGDGKSGQLLQRPGFRLLLSDVKGKNGDNFRLTLQPFDDAVNELRKRIKAVEVGRMTSIISASYMNTDPILARDVVNSLVQAYLEQSVSLKAEEASRTVEFVEKQLEELRKNLDASEIDLQKYKSQSGIMSLDTEAKDIIQKITEKEKARTELEVQKQVLLTDHTREHPAVKAIEKQQESLQQQLATYEMNMRNLPEGERDLARLTRLSTVNANIYTYLLQKHEEARIARASTISNINIVDPAITPRIPVKPQKARNLLLGLVFGFALGLGLVFFLEYLDDSIKDADEAKRVMGLPILAIIPHIFGREQKRNGSSKDENVLIMHNEPKSIAAEAFRSLRTNLHFTAINKEKKIMLFTSTFPQEGKSTITANEAVAISQTGARVLIIDCDLRRSSLHEKFGHSKTPGLSEILTGDVTFEMALHDTGIPNLDLITAGTTPPNPSELLGSEVMRQFLLARRENYAYIIIDAPPVLAVTDAPVLTAVADIVILVMEAGRVPIKAAQHMRDALATLQTPIAGMIINDKTGKGESYGYYGGRYGRYGKGYGYGYYAGEDSMPQQKISTWQKLFPGNWKKKKK